jgi:hypothetical protein
MLSIILLSLSPCNNFYSNNNNNDDDGGGGDDDDDDDARLQDPILLLKIPMGMQKNFCKNYRQFGRTLSKRFTSPAL